MFRLMRVYRDEYGQTRQRYVGNREYKRLETARRRADESKGGYVIRVGSNVPIYVGEWQ